MALLSHVCYRNMVSKKQSYDQRNQKSAWLTPLLEEDQQQIANIK